MLIQPLKAGFDSEVKVRCSNVLTLSIEVRAGIDFGESRKPSRLSDQRGYYG
jgi:hypothetical protein